MADRVKNDKNKKGDPDHLAGYRLNEGGKTDTTNNNDNMQRFVDGADMHGGESRMYTNNNNDNMERLGDSADVHWQGATTHTTKNNVNTSERTKGLRSPVISNMEWGCVDVEGIDSFKDVVLYPGGAHSWDWKKNGTRHQPGIHRGDVNELISYDCEIIILSRGMQNMLYTSNEAQQLLEQKGMELNKNYFILQSEDAVKLYNQYVKTNARVGALIHSTC